MTRLEHVAYRLVLLAFPVAFRRRHGDDMVEHFTQQRQAVRGRVLASAALWSRAGAISPSRSKPFNAW